MSLEKIYSCQYCGKTFKRRTWYDKHECAKKKRFVESHNIDTIRAHRVFVHWQRRTGLLKGGKTREMKDFLNSPFYGAFKNLIEFSNNQNLFSSYKYVDWIVDHGIKERDWYDPSNIAKFTNYLRNTEKPEIQAKSTRRFILDYCENNNVEQDDFFNTISVPRALDMVRENGITPWVLFGYDKSLEDLCSRISGEHYALLDELVNIDRWVKKIEKYPEGRDIVKSILEE